MWELDNKESWAPKNWCCWTVVLEKTLESRLNRKIKSVNPKGNQLWILIGRADTEAEPQKHWPPVAKSHVIGKDADAGKDWRQEKVITLNKMVGWHNRLNEYEFQHDLGDVEGQGGLACCSRWSLKKSNMIQQLKKVSANKRDCHLIQPNPAEENKQTHLIPPEYSHKSHPTETYTKHWINLTHQGKKSKWRSNSTSKLGKRRSQTQ